MTIVSNIGVSINDNKTFYIKTLLSEILKNYIDKH